LGKAGTQGGNVSILNFDDRINQQPTDVTLAYATRADFQRIFTEDIGSLHLLALLLTADLQKAEQVFVAGLEESIRGNPVFKQWARSWSKRVIIRNAIKLVAPSPAGQENSAPSTCAADAPSEKNAWIAAIMQLPAFERFIFVISVLEGHSESDCASLLGCSMQEMNRARSRALTRIAAAGLKDSSKNSRFSGRRCAGSPKADFAPV
jgi:DNA-directed RNA polymerase specialized sigma24 family protein